MPDDHELSQLFAAPVQAAIRAQTLAALETLSYIEQVGTEAGSLRMIRLQAKYPREERLLDPKTGDPTERIESQPFEISVPLLSLAPPPALAVSELNVEFGIDIVTPKAIGFESKVVSGGASGTSLASSRARYASLTGPNPASMRVTMKISRDLQQEGLSRFSDLVANMLSGSPPARAPPPAGRKAPVEAIAGIGPENAKLLQALDILTVEDLVIRTNQVEARAPLAKRLGVTEARVNEWREKALLIQKQKPETEWNPHG